MTRSAQTSRLSWRSRRGVASALIIMILVLLIFFGILSLVTTAADLRLSDKRADWNKEYYLADARAVQLLAGLDQYCGSLKSASLEPSILSEVLTEYLDDAANVQDYQLAEQSGNLKLSLLVAEKPDTGQGIKMVLQVRTGQLETGANRFSVLSWAQWQPPFEYDGQNSGLWKG